jgi:hypothetical protein
VKDVVQMRRQLEKKLQFDANAREEFEKGMKQYFSDSYWLRVALLPTHSLSSSSTSSTTSFFSAQDSLIKNLLSIDSIQPALIDFLFEKLPEFMLDDGFVNP